MDSAVTNMVTNGYTGYKRFRSIEINLIQHIEYRFWAIFRIQLGWFAIHLVILNDLNTNFGRSLGITKNGKKSLKNH